MRLLSLLKGALMYRGDFGTACHLFWEWAENHRLEVLPPPDLAAFCSGGQLRFVPLQLGQVWNASTWDVPVSFGLCNVYGLISIHNECVVGSAGQ